MKTTNIVTLKAAVEFLGSKNVNLADVQALVHGPRHKPVQGWTFDGNWKKKVAPYYY